MKKDGMTNQEILQCALQQSAIDSHCEPEDFLRTENIIVVSEKNENARRYLTLPFACNLVSYGSNVVASVQEELQDTVRQYIEKYPVEHLFETPNMQVINTALMEHGLQICFMAEYFLPDGTVLRDLPCAYEMRILEQKDFETLYVPEWSNALCADRKHLDMLGIGAYDGDKLIGLAGCSADCETMWQIGIDVLPPYRRQGVAAALTAKLALETFARGKVPFYCAAWSNIKSVRNAIKAGFRPAWVEMTAKEISFVEKLNNETVS